MKNFVYDKGRHFDLNDGRIDSFTIVKSDRNVNIKVGKIQHKYNDDV